MSPSMKNYPETIVEVMNFAISIAISLPTVDNRPIDKQLF